MSTNTSKNHGMIAFIAGIINLLAGALSVKYNWGFLFPLFFLWIMPFFIVNSIEKRDVSSLGLSLEREMAMKYVVYALSGFIVLTILLVSEQYILVILVASPSHIIQKTNLLTQIIVQLGGIGLPEELFFRGYLFIRFRGWLGQTRGLILSSLFFGLGHTTSRLIEYGQGYWLPAGVIGFSTLLGGMVLGYLVIKTKNVFVPACSHILLNILGVWISSYLLLTY